MIFDEDVVVEVIETDVADERFEVVFKLLVECACTFMDHFLGSHGFCLNFLVESKSAVKALPDTAQLGERAE